MNKMNSSYFYNFIEILSGIRVNVILSSAHLMSLEGLTPLPYSRSKLKKIDLNSLTDWQNSPTKHMALEFYFSLQNNKVVKDRDICYDFKNAERH